MDNKYFNTPAPAFSSFREIMEIYDKHCFLQEQKDKIGEMLDRHEISLFFKHNGKDELNYFGAPENSRIIFAKLKNNDEDEPMMPGFRDQAKFLAINLLKSMISDDDPSETLFGVGDIPQINVCDREEVIEKMLTHKPKSDKKKKAKKKDE